MHPRTFLSPIVVCLLWLPALGAATYLPRQSVVTAAEIIGYGDFGGDGQVQAIVVDRATGLYRRALPQGNGSLLFTAPAPTGLGSADALAVGSITETDRDQLAIAGVAANRTHIIDPTAPAAFPTAAFTLGVGHRALAAIDINFSGNDPARMDLYVLTGWHDELSTAALIQSTASGLATVSEGPAPTIAAAHRVRLAEGHVDRLLLIMRNPDGSEEAVSLSDPQTPASPPLQTLFGFPVDTRVTHGPLRGSTNNQFLFHSPGSPVLRVSTASPGTLLGTPVAHDLGAPIASLHLAHNGSRLGFFVIFEGGTQATYYGLNASFAPFVIATLSAPPGERFNGVIAPVNGHATLLTGPASGGPSTAAAHYAASGSNWNHQSTTPLAPLGINTALQNLFLYNGEPFVNPAAGLRYTAHIPDWTGGLTVTSLVRFGAALFGENGLSSGTAINLGAPPPGVTHGLANQYRPHISFSGLSRETGARPPPVEANPLPGAYGRYFTVTLSSPEPGVTIHYRDSAAATWSSAPGPVEIAPPGNTLTPFFIRYFGEKDGLRSAVVTAHYSFTGDPGSLDSDGDGIPDYVKLALGLDPRGGPDSDFDGYSDLREILAGTDPANPASTPAALDPLNLQNVFDLALRPLSFSTFTTTTPTRPALPETGDPNFPPPANLRAHDLDGRLLRSTQTRLNPQDSFTGASAYLAGLPASPRDGFVVASTDRTFAIQPAPSRPILDDQGIELLALVPIPGLRLDPVSYTPPPGTDPVAAANAWIAAAQAHYAALARPLIEQDLTYLDTLKLLLTERVLALLLHERDPTFPRDSFSLTGFRDPVPAADIPAEALLALQSGPSAHRLHEIFATVSAGIDSPFHTSLTRLRSLGLQVYRTANLQAAASPGLYPSPIDTLRAFLRGEDLPGHPDTSYAAAVTLTSAQLAAARTAPAIVRNALSPRPTATFHATVSAQTFASPVPVLRNLGDDTPLRLYDAAGDPFPFPRGLALLPGTELEILAYNDRTDAPFVPNEAVETLAVTVTRLPVPAPVDTDGNALDDAWERYLFGTTGNDPFADASGNGYTNLQAFLDGTHPLVPASTPPTDPIPAGPPPVAVHLQGGELAFRIQFPTRYAAQIGFQLQSSPTLEAFTDTPLAATPNGQTFALNIPHNPTSPATSFHRFRLFLRTP
ncbi:MAG: hypothetical protein JJT96_03995 [Opitutales bacterium]|nr:hypothetical protein [Opitutales bacterium]